MSLKGQALKDVVLERLVVAADEIFGLFERTLVEYKAEILRSKLLQRPHVVLYRQDVHTATAGADDVPKPNEDKQEEVSTLRILLTSVKPEESTQTFVKRCDVERSGCGSNKPHSSRSDSDNESHRGFTDVKSPPVDGLKLHLGHRRNSVVKNEQRHRSFLQFSYRCSVCGMKFNRRNYLMRHIRRIHNEEKSHTCSFCQKGFFRRHDYVNHMRIHTGERPFRCSGCGNSFMTRSALGRHKCSKTESQESGTRKPSSWEGSAPSTADKELSEIHTVIVGADAEPTEVKQEDEAFTQIPSVKTEEYKHCSDLDKKKLNNDLKDKSSLKSDEHKLITGQRKNSTAKNITNNDQRQKYFLKTNRCSICGVKFSERKTLRRHIRQIHNEETKYTCSICQKGFFRKYEFGLHMRKHTGELPFSCSGCGKGFSSRGQLKNHKCRQRNSPEKRSLEERSRSAWDGSVPSTSGFQTVTVDLDSGLEHEENSLLQTATTQENVNKSSLPKNPAEENGPEPGCSLELLKNHEEPISSCPDSDSDCEPMEKSSAGSTADKAIINNQFHSCARTEGLKSQKSQINVDVKALQQHTRKGPFTCQICSKVYSHKKSLNAHMAIHTRRFCCFICQRVYSFSSQLKAHMRTHTGEKPFSCSTCGMSFRQRYLLVRHFRCIHTRERPFTCSYCQKGFMRKYDYEVHMRIHTGEQPFGCSVCGRTFRSKSSLTSHKCSEGQSSEGQSAEGRRVDREPQRVCSNERDMFAADIQTVTVGADTDPEPTKVKLEEDSAPIIPFPSEQSKINVHKPQTEQFIEERPGCSVDVRLDHEPNCSDTDNSSDWEFMDQSLTEDLNEGQSNTITADFGSIFQTYRCNQCPKTFETEEKLKKHLKVHARQASLTCKVCNKVFYKPYNLNTHMTLHTGEKPFSCTACGMKFRLKKTLKMHFYRIHAVHKPYTCQICQKGFVELYVYKNHLQMHEEKNQVVNQFMV